MIFQLIFIGIYLLLDALLPLEFMSYACIVHCVLGAFLYMRRTGKILSPEIAFYFATILICLGNLHLFSIMGTDANKSYAYVVPEYLKEASLIFYIGTTFVFLGFKIFEKNSLGSIEFVLSKEQVERFFWITLSIAVLFPYFKDKLSFLGSLLKLFSLTGSIGVLFYARLWAYENSRKYQTYAIILFLVQTYNAIAYSYLRFELIMPTLILMMGFVVGKGSVRAAFSVKMMPYIILLYMFSNIFGTLGKNRSNFGTAISYAYIEDHEDDEEDLYDPEQEEEEEGENNFASRLSVLAQVTNVVKLVDRNGHYDGSASYPVLVALIPRFLWPEKPEIRLGAWFALEIGAATKEVGVGINNSINMTVPGELYLDFGWLGVVIGCILYGGYIAMLWNSINFYRSRYNILGILFGGYILLVSLGGTSGDLQLVVTYLSVYMIFYAMRVILPFIIKTDGKLATV